MSIWRVVVDPMMAKTGKEWTEVEMRWWCLKASFLSPEKKTAIAGGGAITQARENTTRSKYQREAK